MCVCVCVQDRKWCNIHVPCSENTQGTNTKCDTQKTGIGWMHKKKGKSRGRQRQAGQTERQNALTQNDAKSKHKQTKPMVQTELADRLFVFVFFSCLVFLPWSDCLSTTRERNQKKVQKKNSVVGQKSFLKPPSYSSKCVATSVLLSLWLLLLTFGVALARFCENP